MRLATPRRAAPVYCAVIALLIVPTRAELLPPAEPQRAGAPAQGALPLETGKPIEREMKGGEVHTYLIRAAARQYLHAVVEQKGVDVVVTLSGPGGGKLVETDSPNGTQGPEEVEVIAGESGEFRLEVRPLEEKAAAGRYEVRLAALRAAGGSDQESVKRRAELEEARGLNNQASKLSREGRYEEGVALAERALTAFEKLLGPDHQEVNATLNNLAGLYRLKGDYARAEPLLRRSLTALEKALGPGHPNVATAISNLALLYFDYGDYARAEPLYRRALAAREKALGPDHHLVARSLNNLAVLYRERGEYGRAELLFRQALAIYEKALGPDHPDVASSLNNLALLYQEKGEYARAEPLFRRSITAQERTLGPDHPNVATSLNNLATLYVAMGDFARAEPLHQRALRIDEKALGPDHPDVARNLNNLAELYRLKGDLARAEPLYRRALAIYEKALGPEHSLVATAINNLALLYHSRADYTRAEPLYRRALAIFEKALGPDHTNVAATLNNLGELYVAVGQYARAEPLHRRALAIYEKALGPDHPDVARSLNNFALLERTRGDLVRAEPLYRRALAIYEKALGPQHPLVVMALNNLGELYVAAGQYARAEPLHRRALATVEKALGPDHPNVALTLNNLAGLYYEQADFARAEPLHRRALAIYEKALGPDHPDVATALNNLADLYSETGDYARAEPLNRRALAIYEKALGPEHPNVARSLNNLALLYRQRRDFTKAESLFRRSVTAYEKALGPEHPLVATTLNNLGELYVAVGQYARAETLYKRALALREKVLGGEHPSVTITLGNLAILYASIGDPARAVSLQGQATEIGEKNLSLVLSTGSERQKLAYLATLGGQTWFTVWLHARYAPADPRARDLALVTILRRKGRALDAVSDQVSSVRRRLDSRDRALLDQLSAAQSQLSALVLGRTSRTPPAEHKAAVAQLEAEVERLEDAVSRRSAEFRVQTQPVTVEQVQKALPAGAALAEFYSYRPFNAKAKTYVERFGAARYVAYALRKEGAPLWVDLGEAESVNADLARLLTALKCPQTVGDIRKCPAVAEVKRLARAVDERIMRPVRKLLGDTRHIFVSPDGALNLLPFAALVNEENKYLVESHTLTYLTSGRDLLRMQVGAESREPPLVVADPAFDGAPSSPATANARGAAGPSAGRSAEMGRMRFGPLPGTAAEAKALGAAMPGARVLTRAQATEAALKQARGPRVLHVATHGFFLSDQPQEAAGEVRGLKLAGVVEPPPAARVENPLLRSGLALEGANRRAGAGGEDGILTALEAAALDLRGTKLVVLSACETGVGEVRTGEGVYGLRRALVLAGSESQVMSLWQVSDEATRDLMAAYYKRLQVGEGRTEALRQVQLEMLRDDGAVAGLRGRGLGVAGKVGKQDYGRHPYYWAAFIQSGDWRPMAGKPGPAR